MKLKVISWFHSDFLGLKMVEVQFGKTVDCLHMLCMFSIDSPMECGTYMTIYNYGPMGE